LEKKSLKCWNKAVGMLKRVEENSDGTVVLTIGLQGKHVKIMVWCVTVEQNRCARYPRQRIGAPMADNSKQPYLIRRVIT